MITMIMPLGVGNAVKMFFEPPEKAENMKVMKKGSPGITGPDDQSAALVFTGIRDYFVDDVGLMNGVTYWFKPFYLIGGDWVGGDERSVIPAYTDKDLTSDPLTVLRERLRSGFESAIEAGEVANVRVIPVYDAPPQNTVDTPFPCVSLIYADESPAEEFIGMDIIGDSLDDESSWFDSHGYIGNFSIDIGIWCINPVQRRTLRKILRKLLLANNDVFSSHGFVNVTYNTRDEDMLNESPPLYIVIGSFRCQAPVLVGSDNTNVIREININGRGYDD